MEKSEIDEKQRRYLVYLATMYGIGSRDIGKLWAYFNRLDKVAKGSVKDFIAAGLSPVKSKRLHERITMQSPEMVMVAYRENKIDMITYFDDEFPELLKEVPHCPYVLFAKGRIDDLNSWTHLAIVGTRKPSSYGRQVCRNLTESLVAKKVSIVSGLAYGVDATAHKASLEAKGKTVAILGHGLETIQPKANEKLANEIIKAGGTLLSEYPIGTPALRQHFPARNRLVAGMSQGTLVVEGTEKSGSLITAGFAQEYKRSLFAVPGAITNPMSVGPNKLIKEGAISVLSVDDITDELKIFQPTQEGLFSQTSYTPETKEERLILEALKVEPMTIDDLVRMTKLDAATVSATLTELLILEIVSKSYQKFTLN